MKTSTKLFLTTALVGTVVAAGTFTASAYQGDPSVQGPNYTEERHEAMEAAFENNDYAAWLEQMNGKGRVTEVVTEDNFARFAEAHKLAENGDTEGAKAIRAELGLGLKDGSGQGRGQGSGQGHGSRGGAKDGTGSRGQGGTCPYTTE